MRRFRSRLMAPTSIRTPAGKSSTIAVRPGPWDSPAVRKRRGISSALATLLPQAIGHRERSRPGRDDLGREEDEELVVLLRLEHALEEPAERRDATQVGQARLAVVLRLAVDAAE